MKYKGKLTFAKRGWKELHADGEDPRDAMATMLRQVQDDAPSLGISPDDHCTLQVAGETASFFLEDIPRLIPAAGMARHEMEDEDFRVAGAVAPEEPWQMEYCKGAPFDLQSISVVDDPTDPACRVRGKNTNKVSLTYLDEDTFGVRPSGVVNIVHDQVVIEGDLTAHFKDIDGAIMRAMRRKDNILKKIALDTIERINSARPIEFPRGNRRLNVIIQSEAAQRGAQRLEDELHDVSDHIEDDGR